MNTSSSPVVSVGNGSEATIHPPSTTVLGLTSNLFQLVTEWCYNLFGDQEVTNDQTVDQLTNDSPSLGIKIDNIEDGADVAAGAGVVAAAAVATDSETKQGLGIVRESRQPFEPPFCELGLGKLTFGVLSPTTAVLFALYTWKYPDLPVHLPVFGLCFGTVFLLNGHALAYIYPGFARTSEELGVIAVFSVFFELLAQMLSPELVWVPRACILLVATPLIDLRLPPHKCIPAATVSQRGWG